MKKMREGSKKEEKGESKKKEGKEIKKGIEKPKVKSITNTKLFRKITKKSKY